MDVTPVQPVIINSSLSNILCAYGSSSDEDEPKDTKQKIVSAKLIKETPNVDIDEAPEESKIERVDPIVGVETIQPTVVENVESVKMVDKVKVDKGETSKSGIHQRKYFRKKKRATLLEKLLANEIRHERNVLLQCIQYVVENKFLQ